MDVSGVSKGSEFARLEFMRSEVRRVARLEFVGPEVQRSQIADYSV